MSALSEEIKQQILALTRRYPVKQAVTLPAAHLVQQANRCVSLSAVKEIAELLELSPAQVHDTLSFYGFFRDEHRPLGKKRVWICRSLPCMLRGGEELLASASRQWDVPVGQTTADGEVTLELAECLGGCEGAPCLLVNDELVLNADDGTLDQLRKKSP
jgi:NADH-quinone oxidoreductase subunit E